MNISQEKKSLILKKNNLSEKLFITFIILFLIRILNSIPFDGIDINLLEKANLSKDLTFTQIFSLYSSNEKFIIGPFSLGLLPFINASIVIDIFTTFIPKLEKLQSEEGEKGKSLLMKYKKILSIFFIILQSISLLLLILPYIYDRSIFSIINYIIKLICGSLINVWFANQIDNFGIGNGISLIIFSNIILSFFKKFFFITNIFESFTLVEIIIINIFIYLVCILQSAKHVIPIISAKQLAFKDMVERNNIEEEFKDIFFLKGQENGLILKFNQSGVFPLILVANFFPLLEILTNKYISFESLLGRILYYFLLITFNYLYTILFWDPTKISEQLRKSSVSIINVSTGKKTINYLENIVGSVSFLGGFYLCILLALFEIYQVGFPKSLFSTINISSLIILIGVSFDFQKRCRIFVQNMGILSYLQKNIL
jgi:preprotein translocase subunit SecY